MNELIKNAISELKDYEDDPAFRHIRPVTFMQVIEWLEFLPVEKVHGFTEPDIILDENLELHWEQCRDYDYYNYIDLTFKHDTTVYCSIHDDQYYKMGCPLEGYDHFIELWSKYG